MNIGWSFFQSKWELYRSWINKIIWRHLRLVAVSVIGYICSIGVASTLLCMRSIVRMLGSTRPREHQTLFGIIYFLFVREKNYSMLTSFIIRLFGFRLECSQTVFQGYARGDESMFEIKINRWNWIILLVFEWTILTRVDFIDIGNRIRNILITFRFNFATDLNFKK